MPRGFGSVRARGDRFESAFILSGKRVRSPKLFDTHAQAEEWLSEQRAKNPPRTIRRSNRFGNVQRLPSGKWRASHVHEGKRHYAPDLFLHSADAGAWLANAQAAISNGRWIEPDAGRVSFEVYAEKWIAGRTDLRPRSVEQYRGLMRRNLFPKFGTMELVNIKPSDIRSWHGMLKATHPTTAAHAYRLLRGIYNAAVDDGDVAANPCKIKKGGSESAPERPVPTATEVGTLIEAMSERLRLAVILAAWGGLRRGEILGLQRRDVDAKDSSVRVERALHELHSGSVHLGPPKSHAGIRTVHLPLQAMTAVLDHLKRFTGPESDACLFVGPKAGKPMRPRDLETSFRKARVKAGLPGIRLHDLRHFNLTTFATLGATTREVMSRAGHSSPAAAIRYQHATEDRSKALTSKMDALIDG